MYPDQHQQEEIHDQEPDFGWEDDEEEEDDARSDVVMRDAPVFEEDDVVVEDASDAEGLRPRPVQVICQAGPSSRMV